MRIIYLDQNKWIELARAIKRPNEYIDLKSLLSKIRAAITANRLALPLTSTNIYETQKINDPERRRDLASVQAELSRGLVFRARHTRIVAELSVVLADCCKLTPPIHSHHWFLSNIFFEAFSEWQDNQLGFKVSEKFIEFVRQNPSMLLYDYLTELPEDVRKSAVRNFSDGLENLRKQVEDRRAAHGGESESIRRKFYSALLMINDHERILGVARELGIPWGSVQDMGSVVARRIINEVPTYRIEREIALRLEAQNRPISENDFRDMQAFCAVIPYATLVIGEKQFVNLAKQANLDTEYDTRLETEMHALGELLDQS